MSKGKAASKPQPPPAAAPSLFEAGEWRWLLLITAATFASFLPTFWNGFVDWDDGANFIENTHYRGLSPAHLKWMFTTFYAGHYQPLSWVTLGLDYSIWKLNPVGFHLTNLLLHAANAVAFYFVLKLFLRRGAILRPETGSFGFRAACAVGALFFALHPLRVESVAWATERRDVLSGLFYLLTVLAYLRWREEDGRRNWYFLALIFFLLSCLSKAWGITLPAVLLVLDAYPLKRIPFDETWRKTAWKLVREKLPFFAIAFATALLAFLAQKHWAMRKITDHGLFDRLVQAAYGLFFYPAKTVWPVDLSPLYLLSIFFDPLKPKFIVSAALAVGITVGLFLLRRRWPWALAAWVCYGITVSPVLGLAQSGDQIAADRYTYLACLPFAVLAGAGLLQCWRGWKTGALKQIHWHGAVAVSMAILGALAVLTFRQTKVWHDSVSLWEQAAKADADNYVAYLNVTANHKAKQGLSTDPADDDRPFPARPAMAYLYNNRGSKRSTRGKKTGALEDYTKAIELQPKYAEAYYNRGVLRADQGDAKAALADYEKAVQVKPGYGLAWLNRGVVREKLGDANGALEDYNTALRADAKLHQAHLNRGNILLARGDFNGALADYDAAITLDPRYALAYLNRGVLRWKQQNMTDAANDFAKSLEVAPPNWSARQQAEQLLAMVRNSPTPGKK